VIILYSGGHRRIIAPPLMDVNYGVSTPTSSVSTEWQNLSLVKNDGISIPETPFEFIPLSGDRNRKFNGKMLMYAQSLGTSIWFSLRLLDTGDDNRVVAEETDFVLYPESQFGLQKISLVLNAKDTDNNHNFVLQAKSRTTTPTFSSTNMLINSAYFVYI
jgi:hypothetical protein